MTIDAAHTADCVRVEVDSDGIAVVEFERGKANYFDAAMIEGIADAYDSLGSDPRARVIVLCAAGRNFCAGMDFGSRSDIVPTVSEIYDNAVRLFESPLPVVAAVQGATVGGGLGLAMSADFRVGAPSAWVSANFAALGIHHGFGLTVTLPSAVGEQVAADLLLSGRRITADEAQHRGVFDRLSVTDDSLRAEAIAWAREFARCAPLAVRSIRKTLRGRALVDRVRSAVEHELAQQTPLFETTDFVEGIAAARERRAPQFSAR
ncbi:enoyl-CoA hydratase/isomerase family protein [Rhodococcus koreensis]|uniref:enoyl-CoA hydratase/isomerase family protein n=1 Tax=Rhodococcus koreensis TaxID=99653 RepID=UPI0036715610